MKFRMSRFCVITLEFPCFSVWIQSEWSSESSETRERSAEGSRRFSRSGIEFWTNSKKSGLCLTWIPDLNCTQMVRRSMKGSSFP